MNAFLALLFGALTIMGAIQGNAWSAALSGVTCGMWLGAALLGDRRVR